MNEPKKAVLEWWQLVKPGGHLFFTMPDEDLYEQGVFPSRFNPDHKATFTISKARSWSPVSINVLDLARALPNAELISLALHDHGLDRRLLRHGRDVTLGPILRFVFRVYHGLRKRGLVRIPMVELWRAHYVAADQTVWPGTFAQI